MGAFAIQVFGHIGISHDLHLTMAESWLRSSTSCSPPDLRPPAVHMRASSHWTPYGRWSSLAPGMCASSKVQ